MFCVACLIPKSVENVGFLRIINYIAIACSPKYFIHRVSNNLTINSRFFN